MAIAPETYVVMPSVARPAPRQIAMPVTDHLRYNQSHVQLVRPRPIPGALH
jgi:hypothetical protein